MPNPGLTEALKQARVYGINAAMEPDRDILEGAYRSEGRGLPAAD